MTDHDDAEAEAMRAFYARPAVRRPHMPSDPDMLRDGLLEGALRHNPQPQREDK